MGRRQACHLITMYRSMGRCSSYIHGSQPSIFGSWPAFHASMLASRQGCTCCAGDLARGTSCSIHSLTRLLEKQILPRRCSAARAALCRACFTQEGSQVNGAVGVLLRGRKERGSGCSRVSAGTLSRHTAIRARQNSKQATGSAQQAAQAGEQHAAAMSRATVPAPRTGSFIRLDQALRNSEW